MRESRQKQLSIGVCILLGVVASLQSRLLADGNWATTRVVGPFTCRSEFPLTGRETWLDDLEKLRADLKNTLSLEAGEGEVEVNLFHNRRSYRNYLSLRAPEGVNRPALFIQGPDIGRIYVYRRWNYDNDVRHEGTHALLHQSLPYIPLWLDEGLAEYFEMPRQQRAAGHPHLNKMRWSVRFGWKPNLARMENNREFLDLDREDYRESWAWVHFLLHGPIEVRQLLPGYLSAIANASPPGPLSEYLARRVENPDRMLVEHFKSWRP